MASNISINKLLSYNAQSILPELMSTKTENHRQLSETEEVFHCESKKFIFTARIPGTHKL